MDLTVLKKKISTFRSEGGKLRSVSNDVLIELLVAWENWQGSAASFYATLGVDHRKMASLIGRAKKLKREGAFESSEFTEVTIDHSAKISNLTPSLGIEICWENNKIIRFPHVDQLIDFLKKVA